ncbi:hypothetical protein [Glycocaulis abyssi]|uniref:Uncharacterized protein n=1 Tax=Glycocaulis abyssi TaxID=1433403 RepID=A0ABV9NGW9_9PROT
MSAAMAGLPLYRLVLIGSLLVACLLVAVPAWRLAGSTEAFIAARVLHASVEERVQGRCLGGVFDDVSLSALLGERWEGETSVVHASAASEDGPCRVHDLHLAVRTHAEGMERMLADLARPGPLWLHDLQCESREAGYFDCAVELEAHLEAAP